MVDFHMTKVQALMQNQKNIRNISVIAHVDHGKSTLSDALVIKAKIVSKESSGGRYMDSRADEQARGITIKSSAISLHFKVDEEVLNTYMKEGDADGTEFLINLIDSPGHVDFSSEVTAALRVTDGALVVVDCVDGICVQTETVLRQAMDEKIVPTLCLNKLDRSIIELEYSPETLGETLRRRVEGFNAKLSTLSHDFEVASLSPDMNQVSFCSALQGWGFTLRTFGKFYLEKFRTLFNNKSIDEKKAAKILWNSKVSFVHDDIFDSSNKAIAKVNPARSPFVVCVLNPIYKVKELCYKGALNEIKEFLSFYNVNLSSVSPVLTGKPLFKEIMKLWLPLAECLLEQIVLQLPSPIQSQAYRYSSLYEGPVDDEIAQSIKKADASEDAPVVMYVSKMMPSNENRFIAFGRVFSGSVRSGLKIRVQEPGYNPTDESPRNKALCHTKSVLRTVVMMGRGYKEVSTCPAGNIVGIIGIDDCLQKTGTITNRENAYNIKCMHFSVSPVVKVAVAPLRSEDLGKLQEGLKKLGQSDPLCLIERTEKGQCTIACAGSLHLEICLKDLEEEYAKVPIKADEPLVTYMEGVTSKVTTIRMAKSANKHNRLYMTCEPLEEEILTNLKDLDHKDPKERAARYREILDIRADWVKKIMFCGPEVNPSNMMVDATKGIAHLHEIKDHIHAGFLLVTKEGPLIGEQMRGVKYYLHDCVLHADAIHRGANQIIRPVEQLCKGLLLDAEPILYEPIFKVEITVPNEYVSAVSSVLSSRRGTTDMFQDLPGGVSMLITGTLPVRESFTFNEDLKSGTKGKAGASLSFSHYDVLPGSIVDENSLVYKTITHVRALKKMNPLQPAEAYFDKL